MVHFKSFESFYSFIETLKKDDITFRIIGHSYESFSGLIFDKVPENNIWNIKLVVFSSIGSFYLYESLNLSDEDKVADIKSKLAKLHVSHGEVNFKDGIVSIK